MRTYGRITNPDGSKSWQVVQTDPVTGSNSWVWVTALCQVLQGILGESPFFANYGLPAFQSVFAQVAPDYYAQRTQQQFAQYFASLSITRVPDAPVPTYDVQITTLEGTPASVTVKVPQ